MAQTYNPNDLGSQEEDRKVLSQPQQFVKCPQQFGKTLSQTKRAGNVAQWYSTLGSIPSTYKEK